MDVREPRAIYVPVFDSFFESSIMNEAVVTRFVFLALVRLAWRPRAAGIVDVDLRMFSASINIPVPEVEAAIHRLMEPDPDSGSKLEEGRRIVPINPDRPMRGWRLVNWAGYKGLLHKANDKVRKANQRSRDKAGQSGQNPHVTHDTIRDETKQEEKKNTQTGVRFAPPTVEEVQLHISEKKYLFEAEEFIAYYASQGWKKANGRPITDWKQACFTWQRKRKPATSAKASDKRSENYRKQMADLNEGKDESS